MCQQKRREGRRGVREAHLLCSARDLSDREMAAAPAAIDSVTSGCLHRDADVSPRAKKKNTPRDRASQRVSGGFHC